MQEEGICEEAGRNQYMIQSDKIGNKNSRTKNQHKPSWNVEEC